MTLVAFPGGAEVEVPSAVTEVDSVFVHVHKMQHRTIERWRLENFAALRDSFAPSIMKLENDAWDVWISKQIDHAYGESLDVLGRIVGELRNAQGDPNYRVRIRARIAVNESLGRAQDLIRVLLLIEPTPAVIQEYFPASFKIYFTGPLTGLAVESEVAELISEARAAGVGADVVIPPSDPVLRYASASDTFRTLYVRPFDTENAADGDTLAVLMTDGVSGPVEGSRLFLQIAIENGEDLPAPTGWTTLSNLQQAGLFRQQLLTRVVDGSGVGSQVEFNGGTTGRTIARIYEVHAPDLTVGSLVTATGTSTSPSAPALTAPCWGFAFVAYDSGGTITPFKDGGGNPSWVEAAPEGVAGSAAAGVGLSLQIVNATETNPSGSHTATLSDSEDWIRVGFALGTRVLSGWNYGKLSHRKEA